MLERLIITTALGLDRVASHLGDVFVVLYSWLSHTAAVRGSWFPRARARYRTR